MHGIKDEYPIKPLPAFLPTSLDYCNQANSEEELLDVLIKDTGNLLIFFEFMCDDETWSERHPKLITNLIEWLTVQGLYDKLTDATYRRTSAALRKHAALFEQYIPKNLTIQLKDGIVSVNSLLLTEVALFFKDAIRHARLENSSSELVLSNVSREVFQHFLEYANTGVVANLWKLPENEIIIVLRQALSWGVDPVLDQCQEVLKRYITRDNVFDWFIKADQEGWHLFKRRCADFINQMGFGFRLSLPVVDRLKVEFNDFNEGTLQNFERIQNLITDVACHGNVGHHRAFSQIIVKLPKLIGVDLSRTTEFNDNFYSIPTDIKELDLSKCPWISQQMLRKMSEICPQVKRLRLSNNQQLNFASWGELIKFRQLASLDLSECEQISNDDLAVILTACRGVVEWNLSECKKLSEKGFLELTKKGARLTHLDLSRTQLTDSALIELATRCRFLRVLSVVACRNLTAKGIVECVKHAPVLQKLDMRLNHVPQEVVEGIKPAYPYIAMLSGDMDD